MSKSIPPSISGFTMVRNAIRLNYPFLEAVRSVLPLCDEFIINCGVSEDNTWEVCESLASESSKIILIQSPWETNKQQHGYQLARQTDIALSKCRGDWCFYIQADEAIHEEDHDKIRAAISKADSLPTVDGVLFDYVHFYVSYNYTVTGRNWYRREMRAFKNGRNIRSFRDAQGFRKDGRKVKVIASGARVFHYGYVRDSKSLRTKSQEMARWWGQSAQTNLSKMQPKRHVGLKRFVGSHPKTMNSRIADYDFHFDPKAYKRVWNKDEVKNALTIAWERIFPFRIGEYRNYELVRP